MVVGSDPSNIKPLACGAFHSEVELLTYLHYEHLRIKDPLRARRSSIIA
jgi:hypothetical protein